MKSLSQFLKDSYVTDDRSDHEKAQEHAHILKAQEHETKSFFHDREARKLRDAKKTRTPEHKMHVELSKAHYEAMRNHVSSHLRYSREKVHKLNFHKKRSNDPTNKFKHEDKKIVDRLETEHKNFIKKAKETSKHADALSKSHGQDYSAYEHSWKKIRDYG